MTEDLTVILRLFLYAIAGRLTAGGWLPAEYAELLQSPQFIEAVTGVVLFLATAAWWKVAKRRGWAT